MQIIKRDNEYAIEFYWDDLSLNTQNELLKLWGSPENYDVFPIAELPCGDSLGGTDYENVDNEKVNPQ